jgi:hypothetical protein
VEEQHARARRRFDADGSGTISQGEVTAALRCLGVPVRRPRSVTGLAALLHGSLHMCSTPSTVRACQRACADTRSVQAHAHAVRLHFGCRLCARAWPVVSVGDKLTLPYHPCARLAHAAQRRQVRAEDGARMVALLDRDASDDIDYDEFRRFVCLLPQASPGPASARQQKQ